MWGGCLYRSLYIGSPWGSIGALWGSIYGPPHRGSMGFYRALNGVGGEVYIGPIDRGSMGFYRDPIGF